MTANSTNKQNILSNHEELAPVEQSIQDIEELNEDELDAVVGVRCSQGKLIDDGSYHMDIPAMPTSILPVKRHH